MYLTYLVQHANLVEHTPACIWFKQMSIFVLCFYSSPVDEIKAFSLLYYHVCCRAYGAVATFERNIVNSIPIPENLVHNLTFDLNAYGNHTSMSKNHQGFHFKIFGTNRHRYMALAISRNESSLVKSLKSSLDQAVSNREAWNEIIDQFQMSAAIRVLNG